MNECAELNMPLNPNEQLSGSHICSFCDTKFNNLNSLKLHCQLHDNNKNFKCLMCKEVFLDLQQLKLHDLRHSVEEAHGDISNIENISFSGLISCKFCSEKFSCDEELVNHCVVHPFKEAGIIDPSKTADLEDANSDSCDSLSSDEEQLNYRILRQEVFNPKNGKSNKQLIRFTLIDDNNIQVEEVTRIIKRRKVRKEKKNLLKVNNTPKKIKTKVDAVRNYSNEKKNALGKFSNHKISKKIKEKLSSGGTTFKENKVVKSSSPEMDLKDIVDKFGNYKQVRKSKLVAIRKKLWNDKVELPTMRKVFSRAQNKFVYKCKKCLLVFDRLDTLNKHKAYDCSDQNSRVCSDCGKSFTDLDEYLKHCRSHKEESVFFCNDCNKMFTDKSEYRQHVIKHHSSSKKDQFNCRICDEHFILECDLEDHYHKHYNLKKFICCQCHRTFLNLPNFKVHNCSSDIHCTLCSKIFSRMNHLKRHLLSVHKIEKSVVDLVSLRNIDVNNISTNVDSGKSDDSLGLSPEPKYPSEEEKKRAEVEDSDIGKEGRTNKSSDENEADSTLNMNSSEINDSDAVGIVKPVVKLDHINVDSTAKTLIKNSKTINDAVENILTNNESSHIPTKKGKKRKISDVNHKSGRPPKKANKTLSDSKKSHAVKKVQVRFKKASEKKLKIKSKVSVPKYSLPIKKNSIKKSNAKTVKKSPSLKKVNNKILNKSVTPKKPVMKKGSAKKELEHKKRVEKLKKKLTKKTVGKSVSNINSLKKSKK